LKLKGIDGKWTGTWSCHGKIIQDAKIHFQLVDNYFKATIEHAFSHENQLVIVSEESDIKFFQGYFHVQGFKHRLEPIIDNVEYVNNFFELEFLGDDILIGTHKCKAGIGKALFFRTG